MVRFLLLLSALVSCTLSEVQSFEKLKPELRAGQSSERQNENTKIKEHASFLEIRSIKKLEDNDQQLFPRSGERTETIFLNNKHKYIGKPSPSRPSTPQHFDFNQTPAVFKEIYKKCLFSGEDPLSDGHIAKCIIDEAVKIFPSHPYFKLARAIVFDLLNKKGQEIYTTENVLAATAHCKELLTKPAKPGESLQETLSKCFFVALIEMHPLKRYAFAALNYHAYGFFDYVAKVCYDSMPQELKSKREISRYYLQCFIDTACDRYKDKLLVKYGRQWLEPYINQPDSVFNRERILDIAEFCEEKTKNLSPDLKKSAAFFCFFGSILSLHPRTKRLAGYLIQWELARRDHLLKSEAVTPTSRPDSSAQSSGQSKSIIPMLSRNGENQVALMDCMLKAMASVPMASKALSTVSGLVSIIPFIGGYFGQVSASPPSTPNGTPSSGNIQTFLEAATPCFQFFKRDVNGKLVFDQKYAMGTALEVVKFNPLAGLAIEAAEAVADNITVKKDKDGKSQYYINYQGLTTGLGMAVVRATIFDRFTASFMPWTSSQAKPL